MKVPSWLSTCSSNLSISAANDVGMIPPQKHAKMYSDSSSCSNSQDSGGTPTSDGRSLPSNLSIATHPSIPSLQKLTPESLNLSVSTFPATSLKPQSSSVAVNFFEVHDGLLHAVSGSQVTVYDTRNDLQIFDTFSAASGASIKSLGFCGGRIVTAHQDCKIRAWEYSAKMKRHRMIATLPTVHDRLRNFMLPKSYVKVRRHRKKLWVEHYDAVSSLATTSSSENLLHSVSWDRHLKIWKGSNFRCTESIKAHDDAINAVVVSNDGVIYTGSADTKIRVWGKQFGENRNALIATLEKHKSAVNALALSSDGAVLFSGSSDRSILVWEREDSANFMAVSGALRGHSKAVLCLITGAEFLFSGSADRTVRIWSRGHGGRYCCLTVLDGHERPVRAVEVVHGSGGEIKVFSGSFDGEIKFWKVVVSSEMETTSSPSSYASD